MIYKTFFILSILVSLNLFANETIQETSLEDLQYKLVKSINSDNHPPAKFYKLSLAHQTNPTTGKVMVKKMNDRFTEFPLFIEADGTLWTNDGSTEYTFGFDGGYAEKFEILLVATNGNKEAKPLAKCVIIPFPLVIEDDIGHKIELNATSADGKNFTINGSGFAPNEKISISSRSYNESITFSLEVDAQGDFIFGYAPAIIGKTEGPFELSFSGENMKSMKMLHYWGKIAFTNLNDYKKLKNKYKFSED